MSKRKTLCELFNKLDYELYRSGSLEGEKLLKEIKQIVEDCVIVPKENIKVIETEKKPPKGFEDQIYMTYRFAVGRDMFITKKATSEEQDACKKEARRITKDEIIEYLEEDNE